MVHGELQRQSRAWAEIGAQLELGLFVGLGPLGPRCAAAVESLCPATRNQALFRIVVVDATSPSACMKGSSLLKAQSVVYYMRSNYFCRHWLGRVCADAG